MSLMVRLLQGYKLLGLKWPKVLTGAEGPISKLTHLPVGKGTQFPAIWISLQGSLLHGRSKPREKGKREGMTKMGTTVSFKSETQKCNVINFIELY